mmetsp:Transcript_59951/g.140015  ORF Transcript_59951/g.140015 Transcript_59951/m.140015 type:complete len:220 (-) Transcript_59951:747-1406(-)
MSKDSVQVWRSAWSQAARTAAVRELSLLPIRLIAACLQMVRCRSRAAASFVFWSFRAADVEILQLRCQLEKSPASNAPSCWPNMLMAAFIDASLVACLALFFRACLSARVIWCTLTQAENRADFIPEALLSNMARPARMAAALAASRAAAAWLAARRFSASIRNPAQARNTVGNKVLESFSAKLMAAFVTRALAFCLLASSAFLRLSSRHSWAHGRKAH